MEQDIQSNENSAEIKLDSEGEPISSKFKRKSNKKIILFIIIILTIVGVGAVYFLFLNKEDDGKLPIEENMEVSEDQKKVEIDKELDSDQDGLPDYIEKVLGTDENNADTDGDTYSDFDEIKNGYDPLGDKKYTEEEWEMVKEKIKNEEVRIDKELDSDQDGLSDYIEKVLGTDENNSDTDRDTYSDFDEIKNGFNPLTDKKYTEEEWKDAKEKIKNEDEGFFGEMFDIIDNGFICGHSPVVDIDGNTYKTVEIGNQCWMKENLKVTKDPQGNSIVRYCYDNDDSMCDTNGGLYDWSTAMNDSTEEGARGICPDEWHIPKDSEWYVLEKGFAVDSCDTDREGTGCDPAGKELASGGASGFEGIYTGVLRDVSGGFNARGVIAEFWSSTETGYYVWNRVLNGLNSMIAREKGGKGPGFSIRCIKD